MREKLQILKDVLGQYRVSNQEHLFLCPYCEHHKRKFSINIEKNVYKCWVCDTRGLDIYQIIRKHGSFNNVQQWRVLTNKVEIGEFDNLFGEPEEIKEEKIPLPKEFVSLVNDAPVTARPPLNYLKKRGVTKEDILRWKIGYCYDGVYKNRIIVPSFGMTGYANFFIARSYNGDWKRYKNPQVNRNIIFNELYVDWDKDVILVEGAFDAIRAYSIGSSIPLLGSTLRIESKLFQSIVRHDPKVYVALDEDAQYKSSKITQNLMKYGIKTYSIDTSGYEDIAEMPREVLQIRKEEATVMDSNNYLFQRIRSL
jgi:DNA primase